MNTKLLLKVKAAILAEPLKFDMDWWVLDNPKSPCGTTACIAGHAVALNKRLSKLSGLYQIGSVYDRAINALKILEPSASRLFNEVYWPKQFMHAYVAAKTARGRARVAARRIDHFIKTNGAR